MKKKIIINLNRNEQVHFCYYYLKKIKLLIFAHILVILVAYLCIHISYNLCALSPKSYIYIYINIVN